MLVLLSLFAGCDREGQLYAAQPNPDYPFLQDLGEFRVISAADQEANLVGTEFLSYADALQEPDDQGRRGVHYGGLGAPEDPSYYGGATFSFEGTGGSVCLVVDPEVVFWNQSQDSTATTSDYLYVDATAPDGDLDLDAGLTAYYTGSPGVEMGDFASAYTDAGGVDHSLDGSACTQIGSQNTPAHAGRSTVEFCTIDTSGRAGVSYTAVLDTFMLPIDDSVVHFATAVFEGSCANLAAGTTNECLLSREAGGALDLTDEEVSEDYCEDPDNQWNVGCLELAFCDTKTKKLNAYCEDHFDDENAPCTDNGVHPPADDEEADIGP